MLREILIFDFEYQTAEMCDFLNMELPFRVTRVFNDQVLSDKSNREIEELVCAAIRPYVGKMEIIVILNPLVTVVAMERLKTEFPKQCFVTFDQKIEKIMNGAKQVYVLVSKRIRLTESYQLLKAKYQDIKMEEINCEKWQRLLDGGWLVKDELDAEIRKINGSRVMIYSPEMMFRREKVEKAIDWHGEVMDVKQEVLLAVKEKMGIK